jgi:AraC-like DNA-binding protein
MAYHYIAAGRPLIRVGAAEPVELRPGEVVLLPRNDAHVLASAPDLAPVDAGELVTSAAGLGLARIRHGGGGEATQIVCGYIGCESGRHPLIDSLPAVLRLDVRAWEAGAWVETLFRYAAQEYVTPRPGSASSLAKVSELLFVEAVRRHLGAVPGQRSGWFAGLVDPVVGRALVLLHERPAHPWTIEELAAAVHLSRSAFAERFVALVGVAPLGYLTGWRMQLARHALRRGRTIAQVAGEVGYGSEAAFSRAFKREVGVSPTAWRH